MLLVGLAIEFWYVPVGILALVAVSGLALRFNLRRRAGRPPGAREPFFDEVAVAFAEIGLTERLTRLTPAPHVAPVGSIYFQSTGFSLSIDLFESSEQARRAELAVRADPQLRARIELGSLAVRQTEQILYIANRRRGIIDEPMLDEAIHLVANVHAPGTPT